MTKQECIALQEKLNTLGAGLKVDGVYGPKTKAAEEKYLGKKEEAKPTAAPWLDEAKKHSGQKEHNSKFNKYLSGFWRIVGLPGYKTIIGTSFAWCGLFVAAMLYEVDMPWQKNGAGARNWAKYGQAIDYKSNGIPRGAIVHINHKHNCSSGSGNHVAFSNGDCTAEDVKSGAVNLYGGNQGNTAKVSAYSVKEICAVRWPPGIELPGPVSQSSGCKGTASGESTR